MRRTILTTAAITTAILLAGCGSDDSPAPASSTPAGDTTDTADKPADTDTAALEKSVRDYTRAFFAGDGPTGYALMSERCKGTTTPEGYQDWADQANHQYGQLEIETVTVDTISGDLARVSYSVGVPALEREGQPWVREDGIWRWDACQGA